jgi:hypothetical protein
MTSSGFRSARMNASTLETELLPQIALLDLNASSTQVENSELEELEEKLHTWIIGRFCGIQKVVQSCLARDSEMRLPQRRALGLAAGPLTSCDEWTMPCVGGFHSGGDEPTACRSTRPAHEPIRGAVQSTCQDGEHAAGSNVQQRFTVLINIYICIFWLVARISNCFMTSW